MRMPLFKSSQRGLSLIELMVAISLGLLLTAAVIQVFISNRTAFRSQDSQSRLQESARFVMEYLGRDLRMAGFVGCPKLIPPKIDPDLAFQNLADPKFEPTRTNSLFGTDGSETPNPTHVINGNTLNTVSGTDVLVIRKAVGVGRQLTTSASGTSITVRDVEGEAAIENGDLVLMSDCVKAMLFTAANVTNTAGTISLKPASGSILSEYPPESELFRYEVLTYFIRDTGRTTPAGNPINALFVQRASRAIDASSSTAQAAFELVDGVQDMQLQYGIDTNSDLDADEYVMAKDITDWTTVVSVRLNLLLQSTEDNVAGASGTAQAQAIKFNDTDITADGRLRKVFTSTIALRSRLP